MYFNLKLREVREQAFADFSYWEFGKAIANSPLNLRGADFICDQFFKIGNANSYGINEVMCDVYHFCGYVITASENAKIYDSVSKKQKKEFLEALAQGESIDVLKSILLINTNTYRRARICYENFKGESE